MKDVSDGKQLAENVRNLFGHGYSCAQAVCCAFAEQLHLGQAEAFRISAGFGGGMAFGEVCGAASGAIMVIGLKCASRTADTADAYAKEYTYELSREFMKEFKARTGSLHCRDLIGFDLGTLGSDQGITNPSRELYVNCPRYVRMAVDVLTELLDDSDGEGKI